MPGLGNDLLDSLDPSGAVPAKAPARRPKAKRKAVPKKKAVVVPVIASTTKSVSERRGRTTELAVRLLVLLVTEGPISLKDASERLGIGYRTGARMLKALKASGAVTVIEDRNPDNWRTPLYRAELPDRLPE